jgi:hypothetical protein
MHLVVVLTQLITARAVNRAPLKVDFEYSLPNCRCKIAKMQVYGDVGNTYGGSRAIALDLNRHKSIFAALLHAVAKNCSSF